MAFNFDQKIREIERKKSTLPLKVAAIAKSHFQKSFKDQGFTDTKLDPWASRKTQNKSDRRTTKRRAILVDSGALRRSISIVKATFNRIEVGSTGISYAKYHNRGLKPQPLRRFVGRSVVMNRKIRAKIRAEIKAVLK